MAKNTYNTYMANGLAETFMRSLKKVIQTSVVEKSNCKQQLHRFLRSYRANPHKTTGFAPATLMFNGTKYKTRLPTKKRQPRAFHEEVKQVDEKSKEAMKRYADDKRYVKVSDIKEGDAVLVKQQKRNKLTHAYDPQPYQVMALMQSNGSKIKATRNDHQITRHVNHFKRLKG